MSSQLPGGEWYQRAAQLEEECARLRAEVDRLRAENAALEARLLDHSQELVKYANESKQERDKLRAVVEAARNCVEDPGDWMTLQDALAELDSWEKERKG